MASRFWVRALTSLAGVFLACAGAAESYGRFGFVEWPEPDGFLLEADGLRVKDPAGDKIYFASSMKELKPKAVDWRETIFQGRDFALTPGAVRMGSGPGFELYYPLGVRMRFTSTMCPFLTWDGGTVDSDNPTAASKWILLSFRDNQSPVLMTFEEPTQLVITGRSGSWQLTTSERFKGWIRFSLPFGKEKLGSTVGSLGAAVQRIRTFAKPLTGEKATFVSQEIREDEDGVTAVWNYDRPGAVIPKAVLLAKAGGYPLQILTGVSQERLELPDGPVQWSTEPRIVVRFPMRRIPVGRSLSVGEVAVEERSTVSAFDLPSVVDLALVNLSMGRGAGISSVIDLVNEEYQRTLQFKPVPFTQAWSFVGTDGGGADLAAAHAFLKETVLSGQGVVDDVTNRPFDIVRDRMDWESWRVWCGNRQTGRRAGAVLAVAGAASQDPARRLMGAMAQAGLAAEEALVLYQERRGFAVTAPIDIRPLLKLRSGIYSPGVTPVATPFIDSLMSQVRVLSPVRVSAVKTAQGYVLSWTHDPAVPQKLTLLAAFPVQVEAKSNLAGVVPSGVLGMTSLTFEAKEPGVCSVLLKVPEWAGALPTAAPVPVYEE